MKATRYMFLMLLLTTWAGFSWHRSHTILLSYKITGPTFYFHTDSLLIETDTTAIMPLLRTYYSPARVQQMKQELDYRIRTQQDSIQMDGLSLDLYLDEKRSHRECATMNHNEVITLIKSGKVKLYNRPSHRAIEKITIVRTGSKRRHQIDELYYDASNGRHLLTHTVYEKTVCVLPTYQSK